MIGDNARQKIQDLIARAPPLVAGNDYDDFSSADFSDAHSAKCSAWLTEALNVVHYTIPSPQNPYRAAIERSGSFRDRIRATSEIFQALLPDIDAGLLGDLGNQVRAETFDDFLDHGEAYLADDHKMQAGVIAGVVFEDTIRRIYRNKIADDDKGKNLEDLISALARKGVITGQQSKQAKVAAHVRNKASHALRDEFDTKGVQDTIRLTRQFLADHLGG